MSFDADEEILQDFLVEAGEILELLSEQLVDLENQPDDSNLLNAIFRGFHTVKGGAGFLQLDTLVELCHAAENTFDLLRNGKLKVNSELMDVVLQALDAVNAMFAQVHAREAPDPASPELMHALHTILQGDAQVSEAPPEISSPAIERVDTETPIEKNSTADNGDITDEEFEHFIGALGDDSETKTSVADVSSQESSAKSTSSGDNEITDDEFEALLDELHGKGRHGGMPSAVENISTTESTQKAKPSESENETELASSGGNDEFISDDEFESLLDELHGKGQGPTKNATAKGEPVAQAANVAKPTSVAPQSSTPKQAAEKPAVAAARTPPANREAAAGENTVRVDTKRLDDIMNMVGELVLVRNRLVRLGLRTSDENLAKAVANLDVVTGDLQTAVMKTRMQPIKKVFGRFPRVVRDLARNLKKEISLELEGEETDLDKNLVEALADPLVHLVRNSVDHGIEDPDVREQRGKPRMGKVFLSAEQEGDHIVLSISDDGGGMDPKMLRRKAVEKGVLDAETADRLGDAEAFALIFHPGFSTKDKISDVSGRGVGMDVVKTKITQLNGTIDVESEPGVGTRIAIKVPLTLAIMPTLMVMLGQQAFALPLVNVNEIFHLDLSHTNVVDGQEVVVVREKALPLFHLKRWLIHGYETEETQAHVVIVSVGTQKVGFVVDQLIGQEEVVIKPLGKMLHGTPGMAGATITGDGRIALILDIPSMLKAYAQRV